jgi:hypothetical protein
MSDQDVIDAGDDLERDIKRLVTISQNIESKIGKRQQKLKWQVTRLNDHSPVVDRWRNKVKLDIGGQIFCTTVETLTKENSFFSAMFGGKYSAGMQDANDGSYYIDRSPEYFDLVMEYLRTGVVKGLKKLDKEEKLEFLLEAQYYALGGLCFMLEGGGKPDVEGMTWDPEKHSSGCHLSNNNMTLNSSGSCGHKTVLGSIPITHGVVQWEVVLNQTADCYSAVGICGESFNFAANERVGIASNSWGLGIYPGSHVDTSPRRIQAPSQLQSGNVVRSIYDSNEQTLQMFVDNVLRATYTDVNLEVAYICCTICESQNGGYTLRNVEAL